MMGKNKKAPNHQPDIQLSPLPSDHQRHQRWEWNIPHFNPFHTYFIHISYIFHTYFIHISYIFHTYFTYIFHTWSSIQMPIPSGISIYAFPFPFDPTPMRRREHPDDRLRLRADSRRRVVSSKWTWNQQEYPRVMTNIPSGEHTKSNGKYGYLFRGCSH